MIGERVWLRCETDSGTVGVARCVARCGATENDGAWNGMAARAVRGQGVLGLSGKSGEWISGVTEGAWPEA